jgi:hypothetical protein
MGDPGRLWQALANREEGGVSEPCRLNDEHYIFQIIAHRPSRSRSLEEAGKQVEADLYRERVEKAYRQLIQQALQASEVKLFPEKIHEDQPVEDRQGASEG